MTSLAAALAARPVVLDGGLATELEAQGYDLSSSLWSARLLADDPGAIVAAHAAFLSAGAEVIITASYQVSYDGFMASGFERSVVSELLKRSVHLAARARSAADDPPRWIAASVGPYGAALADGSEYRGDYDLDVAGLRRWHRPRIAVLGEAEPDLLALETVPCLSEVDALLSEVAGTGIDCWLSLTCDGDRTRAGEPAAEAFAMAADVDEVIAVGVNCSDPRDIVSLVRLAATSGKPVVVYPNSGESWDAQQRAWQGAGALAEEQVSEWVGAGARLVGGCCRVPPGSIARIAAQLNSNR